MIIFPILTIPLIFLIVVFVKPRVQKYVKLNICAICASVFLTWIFLIAIRSIGFDVDPLLIGILMGMSVTGAMYKIESLYKKYALKHFSFIRLILVIGGLYFIATFLNGQLGIALIIALVTLLSLIIISFLLQGVKHDEKSTLKKLEDCC